MGGTTVDLLSVTCDHPHGGVHVRRHPRRNWAEDDDDVTVPPVPGGLHAQCPRGQFVHDIKMSVAGVAADQWEDSDPGFK